jgi:hypothetical protein
MVTSPAFDLIRQFKEVSPETERLVLKNIRNRMTQDDFFKAVEKGIAGEFGKFYSADPQTIIAWANKYIAQSQENQNYLETGLVPVNTRMTDRDYPLTPEDWRKEVNKCFNSFKRGVSSDYFHPHCYDRLICDARIPLNYLEKFGKSETDSEVMKSKQKALNQYFTENQNREFIYGI